MNFVFAIALLVIAYVITALTMPRPKNNDAKAATLKDFNFPVPDEGTAQAIVFGDCWTQDWQVLWYGNLRSEEIRSGGGGKK
jgi:hypothetical protein